MLSETYPSKHFRSRPLLALALAAAALLWHCGGELAPEAGGETWDALLTDGVFMRSGALLEVRGDDAAESLHAEQLAAGDPDAEAEPIEVELPELAGVEEGWGGREPWGTWLVGETSRLRFHLTRPPDTERELALRVMAPDHPEDRKQSSEVLVNGRSIGRIEVGAKWKIERLAIPASTLRPGLNRVELRHAFHLEGIPGHDDRPLALGLDGAAILRPGEHLPPPGATPGAEASLEQAALRFVDSGLWMVPVDVPADAASLEFDLRPEGDADLRVSIQALDVARDVVLERPAVVAARETVDLSPWRGRRVALVLDVELGRGDRLTFRRPSLLRGEALDVTGGGRPNAARREPLAADELPNVALLVLDAAHADHFGIYGYDRDTTPRVDAFAADALVFRRATAECPYTMCSMPNLFSGLSFFEHGLTVRGLRLDPGVQTLAEILDELGYVTLGFTSNPNNSSVTATDQGFDEFSEIWETHPSFLNDAASQRLAAGVEGPFFLMLHYVPPHEPYDPDPQYDLFGDPAYSGPITPDREQTRAIYSGELEVDDADIEQLEALYDGNLRMGDAALGEIFDLLREHGMWDDTLVIVTSDHGEAFMEHGKVGHNTTLYEEMLHVPLVVRVPPRLRSRLPESIDLDRLAALGDVTPTLAALLGHAPPTASRGIDLFTAPEDPDRLAFLRSAQPYVTLLGARSERFKAIVKPPFADPELYDLVEDPEEQHNLAFERPLLHAALLLFLDREMARPAPLVATPRGERLTEKDEAMLKALGYL